LARAIARVRAFATAREHQQTIIKICARAIERRGGKGVDARYDADPPMFDDVITIRLRRWLRYDAMPATLSHDTSRVICCYTMRYVNDLRCLLLL